MIQALMKIPFDDKDSAKEIAKINKCVLFFDGEAKVWNFKGNVVPKELMPYLIEGSLLDETNKAGNDLEWPEFFEETSQKVKPPAIKKEYYNFVIDMPFDIREQINSYGGYFHYLYKTYIIKNIEVPKKLIHFAAQPYSYEAWIEKFINNSKVNPEITSLYPSKDIIIPRDYQEKALEAFQKAYKKKYGGFLLADEVGLGKTISAALISKESQFKTILIVTTLSAVAHWRQVYLKFKFDGKEILIINYDRLAKLFKPGDENQYKKKAKTKKAKNKRLTKIGLAPMFDLVIWDESHKLRNNQAMRSKLAMKIQEKASFNLYLSATAGQNPLELSYLSPLLAKITGQSVKNMEDFEQWCKSMNFGVKKGAYGKWEWTESKESLEKVRDMLFGASGAALRRVPSDIKGYPEISRILSPLELDADERERYDLIWEEFKSVRSKPVKTKQDKENQLVARLRLRQKASFLKIPYTLEQTFDLLENKHQVAISVAFRDTAFELQKKLLDKGHGVSLIYGGQNTKEKEEQRMKFQRGENTVVIFTVEEAISLHQGEHNDAIRSMIIHDLRWSAIQMAQIEGRTHRDGKFSQIYWSYFDQSIEEDIAKVVLSRVISMKTMIGDDTQTLKEIEAVLNKYN